MEPVTISGWYEIEGGRVQYFGWNNGQIVGGTIADSWEEVKQIKERERQEWWDFPENQVYVTEEGQIVPQT